MQFAHLLDKNGNQDKYYVSFTKSKLKVKEPASPTICIEKMKTECIVKCNKDITNISDLIELANQYPAKEDITYTNVNIHALHRIVPFLKQIDQMIALTTFKQTLVDQITYYLQPNIDKTDDYKHTIISGPPGTGKTEIAKLLGSIFSNLGVFGNGSPKFRKVTRSDLVAGYLGQTAIKTNDIVKSALGGVLFIDEAYSLGNADKKDIYSKECIDALCELLSVHKGELMVIIAGYETELDDCFFSYNQGLKSRFAWKFVIDGYNAKELHDMFIHKLTATHISYYLPNNMVQWFSKRMSQFTSFGRDLDTFISKIKIVYYRRTFCKESTPITIDDINAGYDMMCPSSVIQTNKLFYYS
jgi:SpoVK/Ycf46/Vps4 family AAA+-type ATPase